MKVYGRTRYQTQDLWLLSQMRNWLRHMARRVLGITKRQFFLFFNKNIVTPH